MSTNESNCDLKRKKALEEYRKRLLDYKRVETKLKQSINFSQFSVYFDL
jgi:hypothetical protein